MKNAENSYNYKNRKIVGIISLSLFIVIATVLFFQMGFIKDLFGYESTLSIDFQKILRLSLIVFGSLIATLLSIFGMLILYRKAPLKGNLITPDQILQKKSIFPRYRVVNIIKVKGLPRKVINNIQNDRSNPELLYLRNWDVISSLAHVCDEISFWIIKGNNRIQLYFTISGFAWFSKEKAIMKANNSTLSFEAAFNNTYPSIQFERTSLSDSDNLFNVINNCKFGLKTKGIPALKSNQTQIDRLINTFNSINEDSFFVVSFSGIKKGLEKAQLNNTILRKDLSMEVQNDFSDSKKTGQSKIGVYAFSKTEFGMHTVLAALLSIWSGTHTFNVEKIGFSNKCNYHKNIRKVNPLKQYRLSNKALSSFLHLPEKPFFTEDTGQPIFEIPALKENKYKDKIVIGNIVQNERVLDEYSLPLENLLFNVEIVGMIGRGKSYLVASIIDQLLSTDLGCLVFDLKGEYAEFFVDEPNVVVYTIGSPAPLGINLFEMENCNDVHNVLALICEMLSIAGAPFSPTMLNIFESALQKVQKANEKNLESFLYCLYESSEEYSKNMKTSYSRDSIDAILNRLNFIFGGVNYEVFSTLNNTIDFSNLDEGKKIIIDFSEYLRRGASTASLFLVCNLILHLLSKHASQKGITNSLRYLVVLEEAMYLIPKRFNLESTASIGYSEQNFITGRSLGIGTITIYQLWDSVSPVVHANSLTKILFRGEEFEKIKNAITLTEEQFNYLPHLPDRSFILKSKSLSGPALLKTKAFERLPHTRAEYLNIANNKFVKRGFKQKRISRSLMELRKDIFERRNTNVKSKKQPYTERDNEFDRTNSKIKSWDEKKFNNHYWEWCINTCPARLEYKTKSSNWIKENICKEIQIEAKKIASSLITNSNLKPIMNIIEMKPAYLSQKILTHYIKESEHFNPKILAFCAINFIITNLKKELNLTNSWKNKTLTKLKKTLGEEYLKDYSIYDS